ncbi:MAG: DegV family protein [Anaerolineae bacterium]|nr:DegV family protein [Anaerolineae bacterium]
MPRKIAIVTDSTCDLPQHLIEQGGIGVVPQWITWGEETYRDGVDLTPDDFYQRLAESPVLPVSGPATAEDFAAAFEAARVVQRAEQVVAILLSSRLSASFLNAQAGARLVDFPVFVHDSQTVSMGLGFSVLAAAEARDAGATVDDILETARRVRRQTCIYFTVGTLDFLYRGGRIGGARHLIGKALSIKPILTVTDGQVEAAENVISRARAVQRMLDLAAAEIPPGSPVRVSVMSGEAGEEALELLSPIRQRWQPMQLIEGPISPAIGVNAGPGVLGITVSRC